MYMYVHILREGVLFFFSYVYSAVLYAHNSLCLVIMINTVLAKHTYMYIHVDVLLIFPGFSIEV